MVYVLADEHGTYYYNPKNEGSVSHTGKTHADFAIADAMGVSADSFGGRPPGAHVIVFTSMAEGYRFSKDFHGIGEAVPSRRFNPRPARADELGDTVFVATWSPERKEWDGWEFVQQPTGSDACAMPS